MSGYGPGNERLPARESKAVHAKRMAALAKANRIRMRRAGLKRDLAAGRKSLASVLLDPPIYLRTCELLEIIAAAPLIGPARAKAVLRKARIPEAAVFGWFSEDAKQRLLAVVEALPGFAKVPPAVQKRRVASRRAKQAKTPAGAPA